MQIYTQQINISQMNYSKLKVEKVYIKNTITEYNLAVSTTYLIPPANYRSKKKIQWKL